MTLHSRNTMLLYNAKVWGFESKEYTWFIIDQASGNFTQVGAFNPPLSQYEPAKTKDCNGRRIFPGFHDSHIHVASYGFSLVDIPLHGVNSISELQRQVKDFEKCHPEKQWIIGRSWEQDILGRYPNKEDIDIACSTRPVVLKRACSHVLVANSKALEIAGITKETADPIGGSIDRYPQGHPNEGEPTGILRENAQYILTDLIKTSDQEKKECIRTALNRCMSYGSTSVHALEEDTWHLFCELADAGELPIRVFYSAYFSNKDDPKFPKPGETRGDLLSCDRIKLFTDGSLGASTAALSENYICRGDCGILIQPQEKLNELVKEATDKGYRLEIHVIGDKAADSALTAIEKANVPQETRPILTHCQILREDLLPRMQSCGVTATVQPQFVTTDSTWIHQRLPQHLLEYSYAWKTLGEKGIVCGGSSDAPVESPEPFLGMYDAIYRPIGKRDPANQKSFRPSECLTLEKAVELYTINGAYLAMREKSLSTIEPGYQADFVIMEGDNDVCEDPASLLTAKVSEVWVAGQRRL